MNEAARGSARPAPLRQWLREPILQFLLVGGALFAVYAAFNPPSGEPLQTNQIQVTEADLRQMTLVWAAKWQRPPTPEEMRSLIEQQVREEVFYREALALGLEQGDTIVRRRLAQKMEFLAEDTSAIPVPDTGQLRDWFDKNGERFALPGRVSFRHLYFSPDQHGQQTQDVAGRLLEKLASEPAGTAVADGLGDSFMYQDYYGDQVPEQLASVFGTQFAQALFQLEPGTWQGPVESGLGWHLVYIDSLTPGRVPIFEEVEPMVRAEWINAQRAEATRKIYAAMRERYEVLLPAPGAIADAEPGHDLP